MKIKSVILKNFRKFDDYKVDFDGNSVIEGRNGLGKTTILESFLWVFCDKDYSLVSNPQVRNVLDENAKDKVVSVELVLDIDGTEYSVKKAQKMSVSKVGVIKTTNEYEVNAVPKNERDFKAYFEEKGYNFEHILMCVHTEVFASQKQADMRKALFEMATDLSDKEVAIRSNLTELSNLLEMYSAEEITAMNKSTLKMAKSESESIPNKIEGLDSARVTVDVAEIESKKAEINKALADLDKEEEENKAVITEINDLDKKRLDLEFEKNDCKRKASESLIKAKQEFGNKVENQRVVVQGIKDKQSKAFLDFNTKKNEWNTYNDKLSKLKADYLAQKEKKFDNSQTHCKYCGQPLPKVDGKSLLEMFEKDKKLKMQESIDEGNKVRPLYDKALEEMETARTLLEDIEKRLAEEMEKLSEIETQYNALPTDADMSNDSEYNAILGQIAEVEKEIADKKATSDVSATIKAKRSSLVAELENLNRQLGRDNNEDIDKKIAELEEKRIDLEQKQADCERMLDMLTEFSKAKNDLLVEDINKHFGFVKWKLFEIQKNGEYKEVCVPTIDGYDIYNTANNQRRIKAKVDICDSFQKFYGEQYPILLDNSESLNTDNIPTTETQLITTRVTDDKEIVVR